MNQEKLKKVVAQYIDAFEKSDVTLIRQIYADDATLEDPVGSEVRRGITAITEFYTNAFALGAKLHLTGAIRCSGNSVAFPFTVTLPGMKIHPIDIFELNAEGRIQVMKAYWGKDNIE